jgi:hypothetical protein
LDAKARRKAGRELAWIGRDLTGERRSGVLPPQLAHREGAIRMATVGRFNPKPNRNGRHPCLP